MSRLTPKEREKYKWWKNRVSLSKALDKLANYEDLEEQGRLIEVTRCRNCTRHENSSSTEGFGWCDEYECITADDGYCSRAVDKLAELKGDSEER